MSLLSQRISNFGVRHCFKSSILRNTTPFETSVRNDSLFFNQIRTATKKAAGSTANGRDSAGRRLGVKLLHGRIAKAGAIIIRQRGRKFHEGRNVGIGKDHTIFSKVLGVVNFTRDAKKRVVVNVVEFDGIAEALANGKKGFDLSKLDLSEMEE